MNTQGQINELTDEVRNQILNVITQFANRSLRTLLLAFKDLDGTEAQKQWHMADNVENNLIDIAIVGIQDPLRPEVIKAIQDCHRGGVIVWMVTGDNINTAKAIATECGILKEGDVAIEGRGFATKSKLDLIDIVPPL
jgi:Ca2+-transporting ATPase